MNAPHRHKSGQQLIQQLTLGGSVEVRLDCGLTYVFRPSDLVGNQEAILRIAAIERLLATYLGHPGSEPGNMELSRELNVPCIKRPSLGDLLELAAGKLHHSVLGVLWDVKLMRDRVYHGQTPLFIPSSVETVRKAQDRLVKAVGCVDDPLLSSQIARLRQDGAVDPFLLTGLRDLVRLVEIETSLRDCLLGAGIDGRHREAVDCAHVLANEERSRKIALPAGFLADLRLAFILRNLLAHADLLRLSPSHHRLLDKVEADLDRVLGRASLRKAGGRIAVGDFGASVLGLDFELLAVGTA